MSLVRVNRAPILAAALQQLPQLRHFASIELMVNLDDVPDALHSSSLPCATDCRCFASLAFPEIGLLHQLRVLDIHQCPRLGATHAAHATAASRPGIWHLAVLQVAAGGEIPQRTASAVFLLAAEVTTKWPVDSQTWRSMRSHARLWPTIRTRAEVIAALPEHERADLWWRGDFRSAIAWPSDTPADVPPAGLGSGHSGAFLTRGQLV